MEKIKQTKINQILVPKKLITLSINESVKEVFERLSVNGVSGILIVGPEFPVGWVDIYDMLVYLVYVLRDVSDADFAEQEFSHLFDEGHTAGDIINLSCNDDFVVVQDNITLEEAIEHLVGLKHRIAVKNEHGIVVNIMSQIDVIRYFTQCREIIMDLQIPLSECHALNVVKDVISVDSETTLFRALLTCFKNQVSALAVVENGKLVDNLSVSDLVGITNENVNLLGLSLQHYMIYEGKPMKHPVTVKMSDTLELLFLRITAYRIHRVYVIDDEQSLIGVISLTDLINFLLFK